MISVDDLFTAGIGFDVVGAVLLAMGLLVSAKQSVRRAYVGFGGIGFGQLLVTDAPPDELVIPAGGDQRFAVLRKHQAGNGALVATDYGNDFGRLPIQTQRVRNLGWIESIQRRAVGLSAHPAAKSEHKESDGACSAPVTSPNTARMNI